MKHILTIVLLLQGLLPSAQSQTVSPFNGNFWSVVLDVPEMKDVVVKRDLVYYKDLRIDAYFPKKMKSGERLPVIVFMNGFGDPRMRSNEIYRTWPKLVATRGFVGISMDSDREHMSESFNALFDYLGKTDNIDGNRIGVYAASANARMVVPYLMSNHAHPGIKAAAVYYGETPPLPYRKDLPLYFIVAELDAGHMDYSTLWLNVLDSKAPWTVTMGSGLPHAFDAFSDTDFSKKLILETIAFWDTHLKPLPPSTSKPALGREVLLSEYKGDYAKVIELMREWFKANPNSTDPAAFRVVANAHMRLQQYAEAEAGYRKSIELDPVNKGTFLNMVVISHALNKPKDAARYLSEYEKGDAPEGFTYGYVGRLIMPLQKTDASIKYFERAIELGPHPSDYFNLAVCFVRKGDYDKAFDNLSKAVENGFNAKGDFESNDELTPLKNDKRWAELRLTLQ